MAGSPKITQKNGRRMAGGKPIPKGDFAVPPDGYPVDTPGRARDALSRVAANGTPKEQAQVKAAVRRKYPGIAVDGKQAKPAAKPVARTTPKPSAKPAGTRARGAAGGRGRTGGKGK